MVKSTERVCYYETLGLEPNCSMDDVRHAYHELSIIYHPDKYKSSCGMTEDEAAAKFLEIKDAYNILKEPDERAFYDSYRQTYAVPEAFNPDLKAAFDNINFNGYSDSNRGFYKVYSDVFNRIYAIERAFQERNDLPWDSVHKPPDMGNLESPYPEVVKFYNYWLNFSSIMDFCWEDPYDEYDLSRVIRRGYKRWLKKNMKARKKAKKEYNNKVRDLAHNVKRLDKRVMQMMAKREEERKREMEKERERRKWLKKEKLAKAAMEYEEPEWTKVVERKRKYGDPEDEKEKEREEWECVICRKGFRNEKQCRNHEQSKKHLRMVMELLKLKHYDMVAELIEVERNYEELNEEEVLMEEKRDEVVDDGVGGSDSNENEFSACGNENQKEKVGEIVEVDEVEVEEEEDEDEMNVLEAMVARRKAMEKVCDDVLEPMFEVMATNMHVENDVNEAAMEHHDKLKSTNYKIGGKKPRRRRRRRRSVECTRINEHDNSPNSNLIPSYLILVQKKRKARKKEKRCKESTRPNGESEDFDAKV